MHVDVLLPCFGNLSQTSLQEPCTSLIPINLYRTLTQPKKLSRTSDDPASPNASTGHQGYQFFLVEDATERAVGTATAWQTKHHAAPSLLGNLTVWKLRFRVQGFV